MGPFGSSRDENPLDNLSPKTKNDPKLATQPIGDQGPRSWWVEELLKNSMGYYLGQLSRVEADTN